ncbi:hypothetical protein [Pseudomonas sp. R76]|uniref:hypothetical protein n=1 Tax=Pseudomonas sp. R76 TaxID=1573711 RepID=UPI00131FB49F|nr:hypothetical protein [Pseudomonas sp. R76]QHD04230.1 hypothetical protein PspR76_00085 [Pseudomonas sp. R76]
MPRPPRNYIHAALANLAKAQQQQEKVLNQHTKILTSQGEDIARLETQVKEMRDNAIRAEVNSGVPTKTVAERYNISASRVSQIAPRPNR